MRNKFNGVGKHFLLDSVFHWNAVSSTSASSGGILTMSRVYSTLKTPDPQTREWPHISLELLTNSCNSYFLPDLNTQIHFSLHVIYVILKTFQWHLAFLEDVFLCLPQHQYNSWSFFVSGLLRGPHVKLCKNIYKTLGQELASLGEDLTSSDYLYYRHCYLCSLRYNLVILPSHRPYVTLSQLFRE